MKNTSFLFLLSLLIHVSHAQSNIDLFIKASENQNYAIIDSLLEKGFDINYRFNKSKFEYPLAYAIKNSNLSFVKYIVDKGADINMLSKNNHKKSLLSLSIQEKKDSVSEFLLENGVDIEGGINKPLYYAVLYDNVGMVKKLIKRGANVNALTAYEGSYLHHAVYENGNLEIIKLLLDNGADPNIKKGGQSTFHFACSGDNNSRNECFDILNLLLNYGATIDKKEVFRLIRRGEREIAKIILDKFILNKSKEIDLMLYLSIFLGDYDNAINCLKKGAKIDELFTYRFNSMSCKIYEAVIDNKDFRTTHLLFKSDPSFNPKDGKWIRIVEKSIMAGNLKYVKFLIDSGVNVNTKLNRQGKTFIHLAIRYNKPDIVRFLLEYGSNFSVEPGELTLIEECIFDGKSDIVGILYELGKYPKKFKSTLLTDVLTYENKASHKMLETAKVLINKEFDVNKKNKKENKTTLEILIAYEDSTRVKFLIENGATFSKINGFKYLKFCAKRNIPEVFEYLVENSVNIKNQGRKEKILLDIAIENNSEDVVKLLRKEKHNKIENY